MTERLTPLLEIRGISKKFVKKLDMAARIARKIGVDVHDEVVHAVDDVNVTINKGEVVGLVGESGCGKSTLGRMVVGLLAPSRGQILYKGQDLRELPPGKARQTRLKLQMIFQDPQSSLNPRLKIKSIIGEAALVHGLVKDKDLDRFLDDLMLRCGLDPSYKQRYPHQFSGGQRQRVGIARALAVDPELVVCDEAVSGLDVSIQAQIINLFVKLREELKLTYLFISHDIGVVEHISDRVVVMYLGRFVEIAPTEELFSNPCHPYTGALLDEVPQIEKRRIDYAPIQGELPSPLNPPPGCHFHTRCPHAADRCRTEAPALRTISPGHQAACHLVD